MKRKSIKEIKKIFRDIYGNDWKLVCGSEIRSKQENEFLWDNLVMKKDNSKCKVIISFIEHENIGYTTNEYNELGDQPYDFTNLDLLDERLKK